MGRSRGGDVEDEIHFKPLSSSDPSISRSIVLRSAALGSR